MAAGTGRTAHKSVEAAMADSVKRAERPEAKKELVPPKPAARPEPPKIRPQWTMKPPGEAPRPANRFEGPPQPAPYILTPDTRQVDAYWRSRHQAMGSSHGQEEQQLPAPRRYSSQAFEPRYRTDDYDEFDD